MTTIHLDHVGVVTPDLDRLRAFYEHALGLQLVVIDRPDGDTPFDRLGVFAGGTRVAMLAFEIAGCDPSASPVMGERGGIDHFAFQVDTVEEFEAVTQHLVAAGASDGVVHEMGPTYSVLFTDPDGRALNLQRANPGWRSGGTAEVLVPELFAALLG